VLVTFLVSLVLVKGKSHTPENCARNWEKVGCFHDDIGGKNGRVYPYELVNHRDPTNPAWDGHLIDWNKWNQSLHVLACKCAEKAKSLNYQFFGLQFYGECWSGPTSKFFRDGVSQKCIGNDYKPCVKNAETECIGGPFTNFIYKIVEPSPDVPVDGGWSQWSSWTACSRSCNGGWKYRHRSCVNPEPENGGRMCKGSHMNQSNCNIDLCEPECSSKMDIGLILDASTSVTRKNWDETLEFVKKFSKDFKIGPDNVRFGIIRFAWFPSFQFSLSDPRYWSKANFEKKVSTIQYTYGGTRTDRAIKMAEQQMFCKDCKLRSDAHKVLLVVTDGKASMMSAPMSEATRQLKKDGVTIIAIGVGHAIDPDELSEIATDENHVFTMNGYQYLDDPVNRLVKITCVRK